MNGRTLGMLGFSAVMGLTAAWYASTQLTGAESTQPVQAQQQGIPMGQVLVAKETIPFGTPLTSDLVSTMDIALEHLPDGALTRLTEINGKMALNALLPGDIIMSARLTDAGTGGLLATRVQPGKRAVSVRVNDVSGVAGFVLPGDRVDVLSIQTARSGGSNNTDNSEILLSDVVVLAVDQQAINDSGRPQVVRSVTLEVSPRDSESLVLASSRGSLQLSLRNPEESLYPEVEDNRLQIIRGTSRELTRLKGQSVSPGASGQPASLASSN
ncbi:Flp pilus assembly protein CpaB [Endozoicomonas sp. GU-1]|uniref:Flp pilus assembly protein CpaB n=1 Tax=Endozoicomonas sp. GU-1 TaxID=3009078 RepID=UPI0022B2ED15|nr:Flp pilus assembly protein CpaB [Endozoicomonas sp. GU-1]WBA79845.1 Flp pilus assembly protein CpaB [Endozoicomonas sp. GU-1]WBA87420.1 Flp pilus assembly protein CpaB [Endozoicomonas sp. GU-1]